MDLDKKKMAIGLGIVGAILLLQNGIATSSVDGLGYALLAISIAVYVREQSSEEDAQ